MLISRKNCKICGKDFRAKRANRKTCSEICSYENGLLIQRNYTRIKRIKDPDYFKKWRKKVEGDRFCVICQRVIPSARSGAVKIARESVLCY